MIKNAKPYRSIIVFKFLASSEDEALKIYGAAKLWTSKCLKEVWEAILLVSEKVVIKPVTCTRHWLFSSLPVLELKFGVSTFTSLSKLKIFALCLTFFLNV